MPSDSEASRQKASPFIKWVGGKNQLLGSIESLAPESFGNYHEPFVGGGAVFFRLWSNGLIKSSFLADSNPHLVTTYTVVRDKPADLIKALASFKENHSKESYYLARTRFNGEPMSDVERAALLIYLNKTCFNGLYRVNSRNEFNVPAGTYANPGIYDAEKIQACSRALADARIDSEDFNASLEYVRPGDFVYLDPPYVPLTKTANFTSYARENFTFKDQQRLAETLKTLTQNNVMVMLSNHATPELLDLYTGFHVTVVPARRMLNSKPGLRKTCIDEVIIRNYD